MTFEEFLYQAILAAQVRGENETEAAEGAAKAVTAGMAARFPNLTSPSVPAAQQGQ